MNPVSGRKTAGHTPARPSLTVLVATIDGEQKLARILPALRPIADELVVGIDDASCDDSASVARQYCDTVFSLPHESFFPRGRTEFEGALDIALRHCHGDWILRVDHDETPGPAFSDRAALAALLSNHSVTHYHLSRRWAVPPGTHYIRSGHWHPDYQIRLFRNVASLISGPTEVHRDLTVAGEAGWLTSHWLVHWDLVWHDRARREAKVEQCRELGPWSGSEFYLYEGQAFATLPLDHVPASPGTPPAGLEPGNHPLSCWFELLEAPAPLVHGQRNSVLVALHNLSNRLFRPASPSLGPANVLISYHWLDERGGLLEPWDRNRSPLPSRLAPGEAASVWLVLRDVPPPGSYRLQLDLVEESVGWASAVVPLPAFPVTVVDPPRA